MADNYTEFDKSTILDTSEIVIKGFRFRVREIILGAIVALCLLVIIIMAGLLASANGSGSALVDQQTLNGDSCHKPSCLEAAAHILQLLNSSAAKPCDDFYTFACDNFPKLHPLKPDEGAMTTSLLIYTKNQERLRKLLERGNPYMNDPRHYEYKLRGLYDTCKDHFFRTSQQATPFLQRVVEPSGGWWALEGDKVWAAKDYDFQQQLKKVHVDFWTEAFFTFRISVDWLSWDKNIEIDIADTGLRHYYYIENEFPKELKHYQAYIRTVGSLLLRDASLNITEEERKSRLNTFVKDVFLAEKSLAEINMKSESTLNSHDVENRLRLSDLNKISAGAVDWVGLFTYFFDDDEASVTADTFVVVNELDYINRTSAWINSLSPSYKKRMLNNYLIWQMVRHYMTDLSWDYITAYQQVNLDLTGELEEHSTWRYCMDKLNTELPEALGALFVKGHFSDTNRKTAYEITDYVKNALVDSLASNLHWMPPKTRQTATLKIQESGIKLGYPDYMMNENTLNQIFASLTTYPKDYFGNILSLNTYSKKMWNKRLSAVQDRTAWLYRTYAFMVTYFNPWEDLTVPAGVLQSPIFDHNNPGYMNFGSLGSIVGRELTHAIDEIGNLYSLNGSRSGNWWSEATNKKYLKVRDCITRSYRNVSQGPFNLGSFADEPIKVKVNAVMYVPYGLAESTGITLAYKAYKKWTNKKGGEKGMPGHQYNNDQLFFISYAQTYCANRNEHNAYNLAYSGKTLVDNVRVNTALKQVKEFKDVFQCPDTSKMVTSEQCSLY